MTDRLITDADMVAVGVGERPGTPGALITHIDGAPVGPRCHYCGRGVDPYSHETRIRVTGWERPRSAGGTNALELREPTGQYACASCIGRIKHGIDPAQERLVP